MLMRSSKMSDDNIRIIIIGGMGFVCQNLTNSLLCQGYNVLVIDNIQIYDQHFSYLIRIIDPYRCRIIFHMLLNLICMSE